MCPVCITTTAALALIAGSVTATAGLAALVVKTLHSQERATKSAQTTESKGEKQ